MDVFKKYALNETTKHLILFYISGGIGTALFFLLYQQMLTWTIVGGSQSAAWTLSYLLSIIWQHLLHRHLVFGATSPYLSSTQFYFDA